MNYYLILTIVFSAFTVLIFLFYIYLKLRNFIHIDKYNFEPQALKSLSNTSFKMDKKISDRVIYSQNLNKFIKSEKQSFTKSYGMRNFKYIPFGLSLFRRRNYSFYSYVNYGKTFLYMTTEKIYFRGEFLKLSINTSDIEEFRAIKRNTIIIRCKNRVLPFKIKTKSYVHLLNYYYSLFLFKAGENLRDKNE